MLQPVPQSTSTVIRTPLPQGHWLCEVGPLDSVLIGTPGHSGVSPWLILPDWAADFVFTVEERQHMRGGGFKVVKASNVGSPRAKIHLTRDETDRTSLKMYIWDVDSRAPRWLLAACEHEDVIDTELGSVACIKGEDDGLGHYKAIDWEQVHPFDLETVEL